MLTGRIWVEKCLKVYEVGPDRTEVPPKVQDYRVWISKSANADDRSRVIESQGCPMEGKWEDFNLIRNVMVSP